MSCNLLLRNFIIMAQLFIYPCSNKLFHRLLVLGFLFAGLTVKGFSSTISGGNPTGLSLANNAPQGSETNIQAVSPQGEIPYILIDLNGNVMNSFQAAVGSSDTLYYYIEGFNFSVGETIVLTVNDPSGSFTISFSSDSGYGSSLTMITNTHGYFFEAVWVKYQPTGEGVHAASIDHSSMVSETVTLNVEGTTPVSLPVTWLSFTARLEKEAFEMNWVTAAEKNNSHYEVEMMLDPAIGFEQIGKVDSKATNSTTAIRYAFRHSYSGVTGTYYFRLKQLDVDGAFTYSKTIAIQISAKGGIKLKVAPNPITHSSQLCMIAPETAVLKIIILDINGIVVHKQLHNTVKGENCISLSLDNKLPSGIYFLTAESKFGVNQHKLIKK